MPAYTKQSSKNTSAATGDIQLAPLAKPRKMAPPMVEAPGGPNFEYETFREPRPAGLPWKSMLFALAMAGALFGFSAKADYILGQLAAPLLGLGALHGLWRGGFRKVVMLFLTLVAFSLVVNYADSFAPLTRTAAGSGGGLNYLIAAGVAGIGLVFAGWIVKRIRGRVILKRPILAGIDRFIGAGVGMAEAALVVLTICWTTIEIAPHAAVVRDHPDVQVGSFRQVFAEQVMGVAAEASEGAIGRFVAETNPFDRYPELRKAIHDFLQNGTFDASSLDAETASRLNELLKDTPVGNVGGLQEVLKKYEGNNEAYEKVRRQLPVSGGSNR